MREAPAAMRTAEPVPALGLAAAEHGRRPGAGGLADTRPPAAPLRGALVALLAEAAVLWVRAAAVLILLLPLLAAAYLLLRAAG